MQHKKVCTVFEIFVFLLATPILALAQSTFTVPILDANMGIGLANRSLNEATVTLTARDYSGAVISGAGITNPAVLTVPGSAQLALTGSQIFGAGAAGRTGSVQIQSTGGSVNGMYTLFDPQLQFVDGAELQIGGARQLVFPKVTPSTEVAYVHTGASVTSGTVSFYRNDGLVAIQRTINLESNAGFHGAVAALLPGAPDISGYLVVERSSSLFGNDDTMFGFESYRNQSDIAMVNAVPANRLLKTGYFAQIASQATYTTNLTLVNPTPISQDVTITVLGLEVNGAARNPATVAVQRTIPPGGRLEESAAAMFALSGNDLITGYLKFETAGNAPGLIGVMDLGTADGKLLASIPAQSTGASDFFFPQIAEGDGYYTGIALLNLNPVLAFVTVEAFDGSGNALDRTAFNLAPGERRVRVLTQLLPAITRQLGGYVRVSSSLPLAGFEVFGSTSLSFLANVPAPGPVIPAQANNSVVTVASGASIVTSSGTLEIVIPPGALASDTTISIGPAAPPPAPPGQRIVATVEAEPSGTAFRIPVRLSFRLTAAVDPGLEIPVLLLNSGTGQLSPSGFTAVVDESGLNASAFVTHFSTFVLAVNDSQAVNLPPVISSLSTPGGLINRPNNVRISGVGFMPQSQVFLDATAISSTFVDAATVDVQLFSSIEATRSLTIVNPAPGGGTSNAVTFTFANNVILSTASGNGQNGLRGFELDDPITARVTDPFGNPVEGVSVNFEVAGGGGSVAPTGAITDANGLAGVTATLGNAAGTNQYRAGVAVFPSSPVVFTANARNAVLQDFVTGLTGNPVFLGNARDGSLRKFIVEQTGAIRVVPHGSTTSAVFLDISSRIVSGGERGLLGLAFHPFYEMNGRFFVNYTRAGDGATVVAEYRVSESDPNAADATERVLLTVPQPFANHNGGMIEFGPDGYLYIGMGDGGLANDPGNRAQDINDLLGKMLRIDIDHAQSETVLYRSVGSNPFFGDAPGRDEIFATGLRNPWRFSFDRETGELYAGDVGQNAIEEIDLVEAGRNYGWRVFEGTSCTGIDPGSCASPAFTPPITEYTHSGGRCSVTGGYVYRGSERVVPRGAYVYGDYCTGEVFMLRNGVVTLLMDTTHSISSFGEDENGELYVVGHGGAIQRFAGQ